MAFKAHRRLLEACGVQPDDAAVESAIAATTGYNETVGNSYTASMYLALAALLDSGSELTGQSLGLFSYGSGSVAEFLAGRLRPGYREHLRGDAHREAVSKRRAIDYGTYRELHERTLPTDGGWHDLPHQTQGPFRLAGLRDHQRIYETA